MITVTVVDTCKKYEIRHYSGLSVFPGCQCYSDCSCKENFKPRVIEEYSITINNLTSKRPKSKTIKYNTLDECYIHLSK